MNVSTEIKSVAPDSGRVLRLDPYRDNIEIAVDGQNELGVTGRDVIVTPADLMAAVAAECDAIVIPRTDLPPVERTSNSILVDDYLSSPHRPYVELNADAARQMGLRLFALAEYLDADLPVDEAQIERLAGFINGVEIDNYDEARRFARRLVANGVRVDEVRP